MCGVSEEINIQGERAENYFIISLAFCQNAIESPKNLVQRPNGNFIVSQALNPNPTTGEPEVGEMRAPECKKGGELAWGSAGEQWCCFFFFFYHSDCSGNTVLLSCVMSLSLLLLFPLPGTHSSPLFTCPTWACSLRLCSGIISTENSPLNTWTEVTVLSPSPVLAFLY